MKHLSSPLCLTPILLFACSAELEGDGNFEADAEGSGGQVLDEVTGGSTQVDEGDRPSGGSVESGVGGEAVSGGQDGGGADGAGGEEPLGSGGTDDLEGGGGFVNAAGGNESSSGGDGSESSGGGDDGSGGDTGDECAFSGNVQYHLNGEESWPPEVVDLLTEAMDEAVYYYNCYADLTHSLTVNYKESVPTAEANVDGWMSFGSNKGYMVVATAMHEMGHTMGVGFSPWQELMDDGRWVGPAVDAYMQSLPAEEKDPGMYEQRDYITGDTQHFWPYGLNQAAEHMSEWSLINHVRIVAAMQEDKEAYRNGEL